jgi:L-iditol 2-dehydrogenase
LLGQVEVGREGLVKAAVFAGPGRLELSDWTEPRIGPGELLVRVSGCGLCGSDILKVMSPSTKAPAVFGHEVVGQVAEVGAGVTGFRRGGRVVVAHHVPCFACHYCRRGSPSMCRQFKRSNLDPGGFAELCRVPAINVEHATFALPDAMSDETASFTEPLACCLRAVKRAGAAAGDTAIIVGLGSIGCLLARVFALSGARVFGADLVPVRRTLGRAAGAVVFDAEGDLDPALREATDGRGADIVMLTAGGAALLPWAAARVRDGGQLHYFAGGAGESLPLPLAELYHRELTLSATYSSSPAELLQAFALLAQGTITVDGLITHRLPLQDLAKGVELMRRQEAVKVYITP